mgnify:CR=1 FL=1
MKKKIELKVLFLCSIITIPGKCDKNVTVLLNKCEMKMKVF